MTITKTCPCNKQRFFLALKIENFQLENVDIFLIFAQNTDSGNNRGGSNEYPCSSARYNTHLYRLAVQAGFYSDAIECWISTQETLVRSWVGAKRLFASFSPVTFGAQRKMTHPMARSTSVSN